MQCAPERPRCGRPARGLKRSPPAKKQRRVPQGVSTRRVELARKSKSRTQRQGQHSAWKWVESRATWPLSSRIRLMDTNGRIAAMSTCG